MRKFSATSKYRCRIPTFTCLRGTGICPRNTAEPTLISDQVRRLSRVLAARSCPHSFILVNLAHIFNSWKLFLDAPPESTLAFISSRELGSSMQLLFLILLCIAMKFLYKASRARNELKGRAIAQINMTLPIFSRREEVREMFYHAYRAYMVSYVHSL